MSGDAYVRIDDSTTPASGRVWVSAPNGTHKAVPADAIVIECGDLPEVEVNGDRFEARGAGGALSVNKFWTVEQVRADAFALLALAEYLRAHPPVDEVEVERLAKVLCDVEMDHPDGPMPHVIARRLYLAGVRAPEVTE